MSFKKLLSSEIRQKFLQKLRPLHIRFVYIIGKHEFVRAVDSRYLEFQGTL